MNIAQTILQTIHSSPVEKKHQHRFLAEYFLPAPPALPRPKTFSRAKEERILALRTVPILFAIDPASRSFVNPIEALVEVSGWAYLGLQSFDEFPVELCAPETDTFLLANPYQIVAVPRIQHERYQHDFFAQDLHSIFGSRIITIISLTNGDYLSYAQKTPTDQCSKSSYPSAP